MTALAPDPRPWLSWALAACRDAGWAPLAVFSAHLVFSRLLWTYVAFPALDVPMHLAGGAAIAWFFWRSLGLSECRPLVGTLAATPAGLLSLASTGTATIFWELAEWLSDRFLGTHAQKGLDDTLLDMLLGVGGGLVLLGLVAIRTPRGGADGGCDETRGADLRL